ncbi:hypothetical protein ABH920_000545 [Catenulispora sp. EB89]|uniref:cell wall-binding repeat-containing protein n=1 Tax=Catenulispora sp. EB89 TaxID=3156257 RepID=UPI0035198A2E
MTRVYRRSARRLSMAAVLTVGTLAPLGAAVGAAGPVHATTAVAAATASSTPVNGPIIFNERPMGFGGRATTMAVNQDGSGDRQFADWHACGDSMVYEAPAVVVYSPDGTQAALGCDSDFLRIGTADLSRTRIIAHGPSAVTYPVGWSPDGRTLYFNQRSKAGAQPTAWSVRADGSGRAPVTGIPAGYSLLAVASTGTLLLGSGEGPTASVSTLASGSATPRLLSDHNASADEAAFSADGTKVVVTEDSGTGRNLVVYNADASGTPRILVPVPTQQGSLGGAAWSPDGRDVAYDLLAQTAPNWAAARGQIWTVAADGSAAPVKIVDSPDGLSVSAWHAAPIPQTPRGVVLRLAGADRVGTAVAAADAAYNPGRAGTSQARVAVISRADAFADALPGNALAAEKHGPLLLTGTAALDPAVAHELKAILAPGSTVYVLGGPQALSPQVEAGIRALGLTPKRLAGADRFGTATAIAGAVSPHPHTVLVATGENYPDALAAGAAAAGDPNGGVVLLSDDRTLSTATRTYLAGVNPAATAVYGVGVQGVAALNTMPGLAGRFTPLAGADRYATDMAIANNATLFPTATAAGIAIGGNWPDALSGGAYIGAMKGPLLLTGDGLGTGSHDTDIPIATWFGAHFLTVNQVAVFGGHAVISDVEAEGFGYDAFGADDFDLR